jgi:hypothetical protein
MDWLVSRVLPSPSDMRLGKETDHYPDVRL